MTVARVAIVGYGHEVNAFAEPTHLHHGVDVARRPGGLAAAWEARPLIERLCQLREVAIVELPVWELPAGGPLPDEEFRAILASVSDGFAAAGQVDGVVVLGHGAGATSTDDDPDATMLELVRARVGPWVPVVVVLDLHANVSVRMCAAVDVVVGYRTNPHVDIHDRTGEAAEHLHRLLDGARTVTALVRLPMLLPQIAQLTTGGEPLGLVIAAAQQACTLPVLNVSVFGGFALSDVPACGLSVVVTALAEHADRATELASAIAADAWAHRDSFRLHATPLADAVRLAGDAADGRSPAVILADVADNPGGGAPGNTTFVLQALLAAGIGRVVMGLQWDPALVDQAWAAGVGAHIEATFNRGSTDPLAEESTFPATVVALGDANVVPEHGIYAAATRRPGRTCALDLDGIRVGVSSRRMQCADSDTLEHVGLDPAGAAAVVVKSRGHFRAGFSHLFDAEQIVEVEAPGVATPALHTVPWTRLPRPVFPLDIVELDHLEVVVSGNDRFRA